MNPIRTEAFLATLKGPPISVLLCFLFYGANAALGPSFIARKTGYSREAVHKALYFLHDHGYTQCLGARLGWVATHTVHQQMLSFFGDLLPPGQLPPALDQAANANLVDKVVNLVDIPSSSSITDLKNKEKTTTTTTATASIANLVDNPPSEPAPVSEPAEPAPPSQPGAILGSSERSVADQLTAAGIFPAQARKLAADPWITPARIQAWIQRLTNDPTIRSLPAVLHTNLRHHLEPGPTPSPYGQPPVVAPADNRRRFIEGKYADLIEH